MYTDNVDEILDDILDKTYAQGKKLYGNKASTKIDVMKFTDKFISTYDSKQLQIYNNKDIQGQIMKIYENYVLYYLLLHLSNHYKEKTFINYVLTFDKGAVFNSRLMKSAEILDQIGFISSNINNIKEGKINLDQSHIMATSIYNDLGDLFTSNLQSEDIYHSVIKYILFKTVFLEADKNNIYVIIEEFELEQLETRMIEIVESTTDQIDFVALEKILQGDEYDDSFINDMYEMLLDEDNVEEKSLDSKISLIFKRRLLIPITDEFLRYNKSSELYDQSTNIDANIRSNKKNNTKIKYIINKMNNVIDYYKNGDGKNFYQPLFHRKAVLINNAEEMDILKKLNNTQNKTDEQVGHYEEMILLRKYPYQNFRDIKDYGFAYEDEENIETIRYSNIEFLNESKYDFVKSNTIDTRIITPDNHVNIVGVALPMQIGSMSIDNKSFVESAVNTLIDITNKKHNNISNVLKLFKKRLIMNATSDKLSYWLFNKEKDTSNKFNEISNFPQDEYFKFILAYLYDEMAELTYEKIINVLSSYKFNSYYDLFNFINNVEKQLVPLSERRKNNLYNYIFMSKTPKHKEEYDMKDDHIPGITSKLIPISKPMEMLSRDRVRLQVKDEYDICENLVDHYEGAQCQHIITWNRIRRLRMNHPNKFNHKLHSFVKEFVMENLDKEFICKSCSELVNLKKYIADWTSTTEEGINMTLSLHTSLENISEYEKYSFAIKNMEKIMEKISASSGLTQFVGARVGSKIKRQEVIKVAIDLIASQYATLKNTDVNARKKRAEESNKKYGIMTQYSRFFLFELKNEVFTFSSNEVDKYKKPKVNNIVAYILMLLINEMSETVIKNFPNEKMLNFYIFDKVGYNIFDGIYIRINTSNDITLIKNYKLLCYVIFVLSGIVVKYNMWFSETVEKKSVSNALDQKIVIHTLIDLLNNVLDYNNQENKNYIYEYYSKKFFITLHKVYSGPESEETLLILKKNIDKKLSIVGNNKIVFKTAPEKENTIKPYLEFVDFGYHRWPTNPPALTMKKFKVAPTIIDIFGEKGYNTLYNKYKVDNAKTKKNICRFKNKPVVHDNEQQFEDIGNDLFSYVNDTINKWESIIGENVRVNNKNIYLKHNTYIIDHTHHGHKLDKPLVFSELDKVIIFKKHDPHFKTNVYYYFNKDKEISMYYNAQTYNYIGYKDDKKYHNVLNTNCTLFPTFSIKHKLLFLGHKNMNYQLSSDIIGSDGGPKVRKFISEIIRTRITNIKNTLRNIQRVINQLLTSNKKNRHEPLSISFHKKFKDLVLEKNGVKIFQNINEILGSSYFEKLDNDLKVTFEEDYLYVGSLIKVLNTDQKLVMYICNEFNKFIDLNENEHNKITLVSLLASIIHQEYNSHNIREFSGLSPDVKRFIKMESNIYHKIEIIENDIFNGLSEEEAEALEEELYTEQEEQDALDVEIDEDEDGVRSQLASSFYGGEIED